MSINLSPIVHATLSAAEAVFDAFDLVNKSAANKDDDDADLAKSEALGNADVAIADALEVIESAADLLIHESEEINTAVENITIALVAAEDAVEAAWDLDVTPADEIAHMQEAVEAAKRMRLACEPLPIL